MESILRSNSPTHRRKMIIISKMSKQYYFLRKPEILFYTPLVYKAHSLFSAFSLLLEILLGWWW